MSTRARRSSARGSTRAPMCSAPAWRRSAPTSGRTRSRTGGDETASSLGAGVGEQQLGQSEEANELIHGRPEKIAAAVKNLRDFQRAFDLVGSGMKKLDSVTGRVWPPIRSGRSSRPCLPTGCVRLPRSRTRQRRWSRTPLQLSPPLRSGNRPIPLCRPSGHCAVTQLGCLRRKSSHMGRSFWAFPLPRSQPEKIGLPVQ